MEWMKRVGARLGLWIRPPDRNAGVERPRRRLDVEDLDRSGAVRSGAGHYGDHVGSAGESSAPALSALKARALANAKVPLDEARILALREGSLYAHGGLILFEPAEVLAAAAVLAANGITCHDFESQAAIIACARNDHAAAFPGDDRAGDYEDFPR